jgi:putative membrane protein
MFRDPGYYMAGMHAVWWIFWISVLAVAVFGWRSLWGRSGEGDAETPRDLLRRRLATGEITPDEYEQRMALLNRDG